MKLFLIPFLVALLATAAVVVYSMSDSIQQYEQMEQHAATKQQTPSAPGHMADSITKRKPR